MRLLVLTLTSFFVLSVQAQSIKNNGVLGPLDEAKVGMVLKTYSAEDFEKLKYGSDEDYFHDMDKGITNPENWDSLHRQVEHYLPGISRDEAVKRVIKGRNNWIVWTGGNDKLWDELSRASFGNIDFIKTVSNHPKATAYRSQRWQILGLINEPCYIQNNKPRADRYGLYLDLRDPSCAPDPFENAAKYPGIPVGSRGRDLKMKVNGQEKIVRHEVGSFYGYGTGVIGLRLFPNPDFDQKAASRWDANRYYTDPDYYNDPDLVKPYRVGMTCAFCHVSVAPTNLPIDLNAPAWKNLSSNAGTQYFWVDRIFAWNYKNETENALYQLVHTQRPGTLDTSLVSSDSINNPRTMNAVYDLPSRISTVAKFGLTEDLKGAQRLNFQFSKMSANDVPLNSILRNLYTEGKSSRSWPFGSKQEAIDKVVTPRILKDASDSVGALGALNRVYVNIGLYSEEWLRNFTPLIGTLGIPGYQITPFRIDKANAYSAYWRATVNQTPDVGLFFLVSTSPDHLKSAPGGDKHLLDYESPIVNRGKEVFAQNCASCHSGKQPEKAYSFFKDRSCSGPDYLGCWKEYSNYTHLDASYRDEMTAIVKSPDFLTNNFLSTDLRVPMDVVDTNLCTSIATNAVRGDIWDNFSSETYKNLPSVGFATAVLPNENGTRYVATQYEMPGGGRGFLRPPSLISVWATAPFFNNNSLGPFISSGTLDARMASFNQSMNELLNPAKRGSNRPDSSEKIVSFSANGTNARGIVDVFQKDTYVSLPRAYIPSFIYAVIPSRFKIVDKTGINYFRTRIRNPNQFSAQVLPEIEETNKSWFAQFWESVFPSPAEKQIERSIAAVSANDESQAPGYLSEDGALGERLRVGPIPAGVPIGMVANINLESPKSDLIAAFTGLVKGILAAEKVSDPATRAKVFMEAARTPLLKVSKCPDFIINKGHYFGTTASKDGKALNQEDQRALIEFMKHF